MALMPYGDVLLGLLWVFDASGSVNEDGGNQAGPMHVELVGTRDLRRWERLGQRMPLLSPGPYGQWDCGCVYTVNADASAGRVVVELLDQTGRPIEGFEAADCVPLRSDSLRHEVTWKRAPSPADLAGKPVKLRFDMNSAKLFSFAFL